MDQYLPCPVCSGACSLLDVVDFNKSCEEARGKFLSLAGIPVYYAICSRCGFCFTPELAKWDLEQFKERIYNDDYISVDPDYLEASPRANATNLISMFGDRACSIRHLDYGGGDGFLAKILRESNWDSISYDPFVDRNISIEQFGEFDLITAFEVFEHVPNIPELMLNLRSLLSPNGLVLFSTLVSDGKISPHQRLNWWYASPRNGHISLFSKNSLAILAQNNGFHFGSFSEVFHVLFTKVPPWADHVIRLEPTSTGEYAPESVLRTLPSGDSTQLVRFPDTAVSTFPDKSPSETNSVVNIDTSITQNVSSTEESELALQLYKAGRFSEASAIFRKILTLQPSWAEIHKNYGNTLLSLERFNEAERAYRQALALNPDYGEAYNNLGNLLRFTGRLAEAEQAFHQALTLLPGSAEVHNNFGNVLMDLRRFEEAEQAYRKALVIKPDYIEAYNNRGNVLLALGRITVAEKSYRQALSLKPDCFEAFAGIGNAYCVMGRMDEAEDAFLRALAIKPGTAIGEYNLSFMRLQNGRFEEGFKLYEQRFEVGKTTTIKAIIKDLQRCKRWEGEPLEGKTLLVITEQGAGDSVMMMRYFPLLKQYCPIRLVVYCEPFLKRLFQSISAIDEVVPMTEPLPVGRFDCYCAMMSLPHLFHTNLKSIPDIVPYLFVPDEIKRRWHAQFENISGMKVGLVWAGSRQHPHNNSRSIPLSQFSPLQDIEGVQLVSLQKGDGAEQLKDSGWDIPDWMDMCDDYLETAALITELDLVISIDTSVAHLAGALGKRIWLLNRFATDWRWLLDREDSPWYPTMKIFRQTERGNWENVIGRVTAELAKMTHASRSSSV